MATLAIAYSIVWLAVALYLFRLGRQQRQMLETLRALERQLARREDSPPADARAA